MVPGTVCSTVCSQEDACGDGVLDPPTDQRLSDETSPIESGDDCRACWVLAELKKSGRIRKQQIMQRTGWSDSTARRALAGLRDDGKIVFEGSPRSGCWRLA